MAARGRLNVDTAHAQIRQLLVGVARQLAIDPVFLAPRGNALRHQGAAARGRASPGGSQILGQRLAADADIGQVTVRLAAQLPQPWIPSRPGVAIRMMDL